MNVEGVFIFLFMPFNITIIRLAEMYLTCAEGRFRTGDEPGVLEDVNTIRSRAGLDSLIAVELETSSNRTGI